jgi:hypothetical protein
VGSNTKLVVRDGVLDSRIVSRRLRINFSRILCALFSGWVGLRDLVPGTCTIIRV